jgi:riboflavin kinase/FMN adenylyltransferase
MNMRVANAPAEWAALFPPPARAVLAIGNFDGLHLGHQSILQRVVARAAELGGIAAAITFDPHPLRVLRPQVAPPLIETLEQRLAGIERCGLAGTLALQFNEELSRVSAEDFVRSVLVEQMRAQLALVGENFRFGHRHAGDVRMLTELGAQHGFAVEVVPPVTCRGWMVSSTKVRDAVAAGRMSRALRLLGRPFALTGEPERGTGTGRHLVVPTVNLHPQQELLPARGVYVTETRISGDTAAAQPKTYRSVTNVGVRPTFGGERLTVESHLLDYDGAPVSGKLSVSFWHRLRDEKKFAGAEDLRAQVLRDVHRAEEFFRRLKQSKRA